MRGPGLDHIAIAARSLDEGAPFLADRLGVMPEPGGRHPLMGTHNRLLSLGPGEYLEVIAIDPDAPEPGHPRWFGLDDFDGPPGLAGWVVRQSPLTAPPGTRIVAASRGDLSWRIVVPDSGRMGANGARPMPIDWGTGGHPADRLPDHGLRLVRLTLPTGDMPPDDLALADPRICAGDALRATIATPQGEVVL